MTGLKAQQPDSLYGKIALDQAGEELGTVEAVYVDAAGRPEWAAVRTGRVETSLVPLVGAQLADTGLTLAVDRALVRNAPYGGDIGGVPDSLSEEQEAELYHYYSIEYLSPAAEEPGIGS
jgi:hypothetical protein